MFVLHGRADECQQRGRKLGLKVVHRKQQCLSNSIEKMLSGPCHDIVTPPTDLTGRKSRSFALWFFFVGRISSLATFLR